MKIELHGLELYGYHGVHEDEREHGQLFLYDVELEVGQRGADDRIEDAVDYSKVAACVREVAAGQFRLLEALASAIADALVERFRARARTGARAQAGGAARRIESSYAAVTGRAADDARLCRARGESRRAGGGDQARPPRSIGARRLSAIRETEPWGDPDQPLFLNAVCRARHRARAARALLERLLEVERSSGGRATGGAVARGRSTSTCSCTAPRRSTSRG